MKKVIKNKKLISTLLFVMVVTFGVPAFAAGPVIVSGSVAMAKDALKWVLILLPVVAAAIIGFGYLMKITSGHDARVVAQQESIAKTVLKWAIIAECGSGLVTYVLSFYS